MSKNLQNKKWFLKGMKDGVPIAMGYFAVAFALGIAAKRAGMSATQAGIMSILMLASAGQYAAITVIAAGGGYIQMAVTTLIVNLRYLLMSCALSQKVDPDMKMGHRLLLSYPVTDEIFGIAMSVEGRLNPFYNYGAAFVAAPGWTMGAFLGAAVGAILPQSVSNALGVALYGMFLAIIIPPAKKNRAVAAVLIGSVALSCAFTYLPYLKRVSSGFVIIICAVTAAALGALIAPIPDGDEASDTPTDGGEEVR